MQNRVNISETHHEDRDVCRTSKLVMLKREMGIMLTIKQLLEKVIGHVCDSLPVLGKQRFEFWGGNLGWLHGRSGPKWGLKGLVRFLTEDIQEGKF